MFLLNTDNLEIGDIILSRTDDPTSRAIRRYGNCEYSHATIYIDYSCFIESEGLGVQASNIQRTLFKDYNDVRVLRYKNITAQQIQKIVDYARLQIGMEYSLSEAKKALSNNHSVSNSLMINRQYCTRFVALAYKEAGLHIVSDPYFCTPNDITASNYFDIINNPLRLATEKEIEFGSEQSNILTKQREVIFNILEEVRNLTNEDIQTFDQLSQHLINNKHMDADICKIISDSGYLDLWKRSVAETPYYYDFDVFETLPPHIQEDVISFLKRGRSPHYAQNYLACKAMYEQTSLNYFKIHIELYKNLLNLEKKMEEVLKKYQQSHN